MDDSELKFACMDELAITKGGDYCYLTYLFAAETDDLYNCLVAEGLPKDSSYCDRKYAFDLLEQKKFDSTVDIAQKYACQNNNGGIPNNANQCKVLTTMNAELGKFTQELVPHSNIVLSKKVDANEIIVNDCQYTAGESELLKPFWKADLASTSKVQRVKIFNTLNGADSSNLNSAAIYVGGKFCGKMPKAPKLEKTITVECEGEGVEGGNIEIKG